MEMSIKLQLSSGKEIVLTEDEYDELVESLRVEKEVEKYDPYDPYEPQMGWPPQVWYEPYTTCDSSGSIELNNATVTTDSVLYSDDVQSTYTTASIGDGYLEVDLSDRPMPNIVYVYGNSACMGCYTKDNDKEAIFPLRKGFTGDLGIRNGKGNGRGHRMTTGNNWD